MAAARGVRAGRAFVELGVSDKLTAGLRKAKRRLQAFGAGIQSIGLQLAKASALAVLPLGASAVVFAGFEQRMARVKALTGATGKDFDRLSDTAKKLGETTVFSASQAAEAMSFFALAGFDVESILKAIGPALNLAAAGQIEIAEAADITAKIMAGMGLSVDDLGRAVDVLAKAMTTANTDLIQLGDAMKFVGPVAKSAGISLEETVAAIQLLSNSGIQASMAGTSLRGALLQLTSPSKEAQAALDALGVTVKDAEGNVRPLADIIEDLQAGLSGFGSAEKLEALGKIFTARQVSGVAVLVEQGSDKLREFTKALQEAGGTADRIAGVQLNTLKGSLTIVKSAVEGLAIAVGDVLGGPLRIVAKVLVGVVNRFREWVSANRELIGIIAAVGIGSAAIGVALVAVGVAAQAAAFVIGGLATVVSVATGILVAIKAVIIALLSPIGLVVAAAGALGVAWLVNSGAAGDAVVWLGERFRALRKTVGKVLDGIRNALAGGDIGLAAKVLWAGIKLAWTEGVGSIDAIWLKAKDSFISTANQMWFGSLIGASTVWEKLRSGWSEVVLGLGVTWGDFTSFLTEAWLTVANVLTKSWNILRNLFDETFDAGLANAAADQELVDKLQKSQEKSNTELGRIVEENRSHRERIQVEHDARVLEIAKSQDEARKKLATDTEAGVKQAKAELDAARTELDKALKDAADSRKAAEEGDGGKGKPGGLSGRLKDLQDQLANAGAAVGKKISIAGTFSAAALAGLGAGGGGMAERTAKATEETAKNTKKIVRQRNGGTFT